MRRMSGAFLIALLAAYACEKSSPAVPSSQTIAPTAAPSAQSLASMSAGFDSGFAFKQVAFPPRNEPFAFRQSLESVYQFTLRRSAISSFVDIEGSIVWTQEYLRYRLSGCTHVATVQFVLAEIDGAPGAPECGGSVPFPPRNEPFDFRANSLEAKYRDGLRRGASQTFVDIEGDIVWTTEYLRYRVSSCSHDTANSLVLSQISGSAPTAGCAPPPTTTSTIPTTTTTTIPITTTSSTSTTSIPITTTSSSTSTTTPPGFTVTVGPNGPTCPASQVSAGVTAVCNDRTFSSSQNRSGTCSTHSGVLCWICPGTLCQG